MGTSEPSMVHNTGNPVFTCHLKMGKSLSDSKGQLSLNQTLCTNPFSFEKFENNVIRFWVRKDSA